MISLSMAKVPIGALTRCYAGHYKSITQRRSHGIGIGSIRADMYCKRAWYFGAGNSARRRGRGIHIYDEIVPARCAGVSIVARSFPARTSEPAGAALNEPGDRMVPRGNGWHCLDAARSEMGRVEDARPWEEGEQRRR